MSLALLLLLAAQPVDCWPACTWISPKSAWVSGRICCDPAKAKTFEECMGLSRGKMPPTLPGKCRKPGKQ